MNEHARRRGPEASWTVTAWGAALVAVGSLGLAAAWDHWLPAVVLVVAALVPVLVLRAVLGLGVSRWAATSVLVLLLLLTAYLMSAGGGTPFLAVVRDSVPRLLTEPQPYRLRAELLVVPVLLTGLVSLFAGLRLAGRTRVGPVAGALVLYLAGSLLTTGRADPWGLLAVLLLVLALAGWVLLDEHTEPALRRLTVIGPGLVLLVGALAAVALVPVQDPFEPRSLVDPPTSVVETSSPLPQLGAWAQNPDTDLFRVRGAAVPMRLVTLEDYDGAQWRTATRYAPFGTLTDPVLPPGEDRRTTTVTVTLDRLGGVWLPSPGEPEAVSVADVLLDVRTGTLYRPGGTDATSEEPLEYEVTAVADDPEPRLLTAATVPLSGPARRYLDLPGLPADLARYAEEVTARAATPYEQAIAIETAVQHGRTLSARAISGSAYWRLRQFLLATSGTPGAQLGTSEQFATAFTVLARHTGLPTRLVVGFKPGDEQPDGSRVVRGRHAIAWPEVYFDRLGWVPFSPTPKDDTFTEDRPEVTQAPPTDEPEQTEEPATREPAAPGQEQRGSAGGGGTDRSGLPGWWPAGAAGGAVVLVVALLGLARWWRSRRHRRAGVTGAWAEVLDALHLAQVRVPPAASAADIGDLVDHRWGTTAGRSLADRAERAVFGPSAAVALLERPGPGTAEAALRDVRRAARRSLPWWRRWWWHLDPRVLGRRATPPRA